MRLVLEDNIVELANGCLCCTVADEFVPALDLILAKEPKIEHIVIETSCLALPKPLVQAFHWPSIKNRVTVDGVVAVVDGAGASRRPRPPTTWMRSRRSVRRTMRSITTIRSRRCSEDQIACADLVVLNKCDLLDPGGMERASAACTGALSRAVKVVKVAGGKVDAITLLGLNIGTEADIENRKTHHDNELDHNHDDFESFVVPLPEIGDPDALSNLVSATAEAAGVLRIKGFAAVSNKPMRLLVQAVARA